MNEPYSNELEVRHLIESYNFARDVISSLPLRYQIKNFADFSEMVERHNKELNELIEERRQRNEKRK